MYNKSKLKKEEEKNEKFRTLESVINLLYYQN